MDDLIRIYFTIEEIRDLLMNLDQCHSEGYLNAGDPSCDVMYKLQTILDNIDAKDGE